MLDLDIAAAIKRLSVAFVPLVLGIILHEVAHGWAALKRGDPTAYMMGRLTLNPLPHIDPMGLVVFLATSLTSPFVFGWAKPVPVNFRRLRNLTRDTMLVAFAGPALNFLLAILFAIFLRVQLEVLPYHLWRSNSIWHFFFLMFQTGILVNCGLAWMNLIPIPPLDGSKILWGILPARMGYQYMRLERYGFLLLALLLISGILGNILEPLIRVSFNTLISVIVE